MSATSAMIQHLLSIQAITAKVEKRVRAGRAIQDAERNKAESLIQDGDKKPYIVVSRISGPRHQAMTGATSLASPRLQVSSVADTYAEADELGELVRLHCDGFKGQMGNVTVDHCHLVDERDTDDSVPGLEPASYFARDIDFQLMHQEETPLVPALEF